MISQAFSNPVYFITFCTHRRRHLLATDQAHSAFIQFAKLAARRNIAIGRYALMPAHIHFFVCGDQNFVLGHWVGQLKQAIARCIGYTRKEGQIWQEGFFDHVLRNDESMSEKWNYIRENPVRAGFVKCAEDWPFQGQIIPIDRAM